MRMTLRLLAAACVLTATIGCQPADEPNLSTDVPVEMGDSNVTDAVETPAPAETPVVEEPAPEAPAAEEPAADATSAD